jgi:hypothetical protein
MNGAIPAVCLLLACTNALWAGEAIDIAVKPGPQNPASPRMGDQLIFESIITNHASQPVKGLVSWMSLVELTPGREQPVDLEDWSAHKAETRASLAPGESIRGVWPMRLIKAGNYQLAISTTDRNAGHMITSAVIDFHVQEKPVIASSRVLPVAIGVPLLLGGLLAWRIRRRP